MTPIAKKQGTIMESKKTEEPVKFKRRFMVAIGRRKTAIAQVRLYKNGSGVIVVNNQKVSQYFTPDLAIIVVQPLKLTGHLKNLDFSILVRGGGKKAQAEAAKHGISRTLVEHNKELRPSLKAKNLLTRDARKKERKKPGLKKARKAPQWAKR
ncbi:30S ribosomal protein S9 [Candidatus Falkowbacteria bacterium]|nr:30S ribosomal protein S9 [Candidatus Falkowbacteria bacterium]